MNIVQRLRSIAAIAGRERLSQIDFILHHELWIGRALLEGTDPLRVAEALMRVCDRIEMESEAHARQLAAGMRLLGEMLGFAEGALVELEIAALVHDIGKLSVEDAILKSGESLSPSALDKIKMHCSLGHAVLFGVPGMRVAAELVLHHHEYWDGSGYADGLAGMEIPLAARVFAVVDSYDAMVRTDRVFRIGVTHREARAEIGALAGKRYDPEIVSVFLRIAPDRWEEIWARWPDACLSSLHGAS